MEYEKEGMVGQENGALMITNLNQVYFAQMVGREEEVLNIQTDRLSIISSVGRTS